MQRSKVSLLDNKKRLSLYSIHVTNEKSSDQLSNLKYNRSMLNQSSDIIDRKTFDQSGSVQARINQRDTVGLFKNMNSHIAEYWHDRRHLLKNNTVVELKERSLSKAANKVLKFSKSKHENLKQLVSKKRQMFLMQLNIENKTEHINKLNEQVKDKKDILKNVEEKIQTDVRIYISYIDKTRLESRDVIKNADKITKAKLDVIGILKKMSEEKIAKQIANRKLLEKIEKLFRYRSFFKDIMAYNSNNNRSASIQDSSNNTIIETDLYQLYKYKPTPDCIKYINSSYCEFIGYRRNLTKLDTFNYQIEDENLQLIEKSQKTRAECVNLAYKMERLEREYGEIIKDLTQRKIKLQRSLIEINIAVKDNGTGSMKHQCSIGEVFEALTSKITEFITIEDRDKNPVSLLTAVENDVFHNVGLIASSDQEIIRKCEKVVCDAYKSKLMRQVMELQQTILSEKKKRIEARHFDVVKGRKNHFRSYCENRVKLSHNTSMNKSKINEEPHYFA